MAGSEFLLGYSPDGLFELIMRPVRGPVTAFRVRTPPPPPPPPPCGPRSPSPPSRSPPTSARRNFSIPTSDGNFIEGTISPVYTSLKITVDITSGKRIVREEERPARKIPPPRPPPPRTPPSAAAGAPPARPPPPQRRWISPPPPYPGGLEVREVTPPPTYGEVIIRKNDDDIVEMITRTSQGLYPSFPPTPPAAAAAGAGAEQAEPSAPPMEEKRGVIRPHSISPFVRNTKPCLDKDLEEVANFLDFIERKEEKISTPTTPAATARPEVPPPIITGRVLNPQVLRPTPVRRRIPPSAALGAPPREESEEESEEEELPDLPSPTPTSDVTVHSTVSSPWVYEGDSSDDEYMEEYEYMDPYEDEGPWSSTPPPACDSPTHEVCVPPAWGERIPGPTIICKCVLCHEEGHHHPVRCIQCGNAPGCCECLWGYMRSRYNSGCPLCRAGDPGDDNPLGANQARSAPAPALVPRTRRALATARNAIVLCGVGRARGRGRPQPQPQEREMTSIRRRGRGRGRRGVTTQHSSSSEADR